jgi:hypothetical protein
LDGQSPLFVSADYYYFNESDRVDYNTGETYLANATRSGNGEFWLPINGSKPDLTITAHLVSSSFNEFATTAAGEKIFDAIHRNGNDYDLKFTPEAQETAGLVIVWCELNDSSSFFDKTPERSYHVIYNIPPVVQWSESTFGGATLDSVDGEYIVGFQVQSSRSYEIRLLVNESVMWEPETSYRVSYTMYPAIIHDGQIDLLFPLTFPFGFLESIGNYYSTAITIPQTLDMDNYGNPYEQSTQYINGKFGLLLVLTARDENGDTDTGIILLVIDYEATAESGSTFGWIVAGVIAIAAALLYKKSPPAKARVVY